MCMFSPIQAGWLGRITGPRRRETQVTETQIFARVDGDTQWLAYQMRVDTPSDVAMILPVPVVPGSGDHALAFVDLSGYDRFFKDLASLFPTLLSPDWQPYAKGALRGRASKLVVHDVGSFEASYVPALADFSRLDPRFRLPETVWSALPQYSDWGFAVFKLKKGRAKRIHPMAFRFPTRDPARIFFPTIHVHDGELHPKASFDHTLYFQPPSSRSGDVISEDPARTWIDPARACGLVDVDSCVGKRSILGLHDNEDTWIE
jgi:hypothetical protein